MFSKWRFLGIIGAIVGMAACSAEASPDQGAPTGEPGRSLRFDPATIRSGDRLGDLEVISADIGVAQGTGTYVGTVRFAGDLHLRGAPIVLDTEGAALLCFNVDEEYGFRLPRMRHDERRPWFCFDNEEEAAQRLQPLVGRQVEVVVSDYRTTYQFTDAHDTAHLEEVLSSR
jgi:hypothetical protein